MHLTKIFYAIQLEIRPEMLKWYFKQNIIHLNYIHSFIYQTGKKVLSHFAFCAPNSKMPLPGSYHTSPNYQLGLHQIVLIISLISLCETVAAQDWLSNSGKDHKAIMREKQATIFQFKWACVVLIKASLVGLMTSCASLTTELQLCQLVDFHGSRANSCSTRESFNGPCGE